MNLRQVLGEGYHGITILFGVICGISALHSEFAPIIVLIGLLVLSAGLYMPTMVIGLVWVGIALDTTGMTGLTIAGLPLTLSKVTVVAAFGVWVVHAVMRGKTMVKFSWVLLSLFGVVGTMLASVAVSGMPDAAFRFIAGVAMLTILVGLVSSAIERDHMVYLVRFMAFVAIAIVVWNLLGRENAVVFRLDHAWKERTTGAFGDPNFWAAFLVMSCPMLLGGLLADKSPIGRVLLIALAVVYPAGVMQSFSRAGLIGMILSAPGLLYIFRKQWQYAVMAFVAFVPVIPILVNVEAALMRYGTLFNPEQEADLGHASLSERTALLYAGLDLIKDHGVLGIGVGMFPTYASYVTAGGVWKVAHNTYVTVWAEQGILGLTSHLLLFAAIAYTGFRAATKTEDEFLQNVGWGFCSGIFGIAFMAMTLNMMDFAPIYFCMGIVIAVEGTTHRASQPEIALKPAFEVQ